MSATTAGATGGWAAWDKEVIDNIVPPRRSFPNTMMNSLMRITLVRQTKSETRRRVWLQVAQIRLRYGSSMRCREARYQKEQETMSGVRFAGWESCSFFVAFF